MVAAGGIGKICLKFGFRIKMGVILTHRHPRAA